MIFLAFFLLEDFFASRKGGSWIRLVGSVPDKLDVIHDGLLDLA